jgi:UPF0716 protein FxsA
MAHSAYSRWVAKLALLFTVVPLVELYLLLLIGDLLGLLPTVTVVVATAFVGAWLAKREGRRVLGQWRESLGAGRMPEEGVLGGVLLLVGGVLLVTPGVLTDVAGLALLVPFTRVRVADWLRPRIEARLQRGVDAGSIQVVNMGGGFSEDIGRPTGPRQVIDVEGTEVDRD